MPETVLFDRYRLLEAAGSGGSAEVWRALDEETGEEVAVKRLHPIVFADEAGRRRLQREFDALRALDEPHIVRVRDLRIEDRDAALVLDFVPGESLAQRLARATAEGDPIEPETAVAIVEDVAAALSAAHAAGIVHRDVTPGNILLTPDGEARLTDFGIAHASTDATHVTATGLLMGTMRYLAPEQLRGGTSTPASDLHSLAAVAYEMLAGRHAYEATSPVALAEAQQAGPPPIEGVPPALDAAVRRGLAVDPADRPADVGTFAASLAAALAAEQTMAIPVPAPDRTAAIPIGALGAGAAAAGAAAAGAAVAGSAAAGAAVGATGDEVGVAVPSRAAATHGPLPPADNLGDEPIAEWDRDDAVPARARPAPARPAQAPRRGRPRIPAPVAAAIGLALAVGLLAAASGSERPAATGGAASPDVAAEPTPTRKPTATPEPQKGKGNSDDDEHGKGKGKGNDDD